MVKRVLSITMYFCILAIPLLFYLATYDSCQIKISILQIGGAIILAGWLFRSIAEGRLTRQRFLWDLPVFLYFAWEVFSYLQSPYKFSSTVDELIRSVYYVGIYLAASDFFSQNDKMKTVANLLMAAIAVAIIYGFMQFTGLQYNFLSLRDIFSSSLGQNLSFGHIEEVLVSLLHYTFGYPKFYLLLAFLLVAFAFFRRQSLKREKALGQVAIASLLMGALYLLFEYFHGDPFAWSGAFGTRVFSTFGNPNFYAAFLVLTAPLILAYMFKTRNLINRILFSLLFITNIISLFVTGSKGGWLGIAGALFFFTMLIVFYVLKNKKTKLYLVVFILLALLISTFGVYQYSRKRFDSILFRLLTWRSTVEMINLHPIIGNGLGTFRLIYPAYRDRVIFRIEGKHQTETQHPENEYLEIASDQGAIGLALYFWMLFTVFSRSLIRLKSMVAVPKVPPKPNKTVPAADPPVLYLIGFIAGLLGLLAHNLFCVNLRFVSSGFFLWLFLGIIGGAYQPAVAAKETTPRSRQLRDLIKIITILVTIFCVIVYVRFFMGDAHHNIGIYYSKMRMWDDAIKEYETSISLNPFFVMPRYFLGNVYNDRGQPGDYEKAMARYDEVIKMAPNYVMVHYQRGVVYAKTNRYQESIDEFNQALKLDPVYPQTYFHLGMIYIQTQQLDKALENFEQAGRIDADIPEIHLSIANVYFLQNKFTQAETEYRKTLSLDNMNFNAHRNLGMLYLRQDKRTEALRELKAAQEGIPNDPELNRVIKGLAP